MRLLTFSFLGAYLTADFDGLRGVHIALGYTMLGLLGFRIVWGLIGPKHVRFKLLFGKFSGVRGWWTATRQAPSRQKSTKRYLMFLQASDKSRQSEVKSHRFRIEL